jgi:hypothetical protein
VCSNALRSAGLTVHRLSTISVGFIASLSAISPAGPGAIPTEHIEKLDLILCAIEGGPVRTMHLGQTAVVTQHGDNHGDDTDCPPLAGRRRRP